MAEAVAARDDLRETDKRETRILIQTHPDVLVIPPDPPQLMIKLGQVRQAIHAAYYRPPVEARRAFTIFTSSAFMKEAANSLLKLLEEPPDHTTLILLTENPQELLPTIRSRAVVHRLGALPASELEALLARRRPELKPQRPRPGRAAGRGRGGPRAFARSRHVSCQPRGCAGHSAHGAARARLLHALSRHGKLPRRRRWPGEDREPAARALSLVEDLLLIVAGTPALIRNIDIAAELARLAQGLTVDWIDGAARAMVQVEQGMRRNLLRSLSLDAMAVGMAVDTF